MVSGEGGGRRKGQGYGGQRGRWREGGRDKDMVVNGEGGGREGGRDKDIVVSGEEEGGREGQEYGRGLR